MNVRSLFRFTSRPRLGFTLIFFALMFFVVHTATSTESGDYYVYQSGRHVGAIMVFLLLPLLFFAYWRIVRAGDAWFRHIGIRRILFGALLLGLLCFFIPPLTSGDVYYSLYYGQVTAAGLNPYTTTIAEYFSGPFITTLNPMFFHLPSPYGPLWSALSALPILLFGAHASADILFLRAIFLAVLLFSTY
ncbi:MAG: hypothetical protein V1778_01035, partial [bacterium]